MCPLIIKLARLDGLTRGPDIIRAFCAAKAAQRNGDAHMHWICYQLRLIYAKRKGETSLEDDVCRAERLAEVPLIRWEVVR